ncbi:hypothetical protein AAVH_34296 [Aphelenchoides avenae]|nr:hypothetical protein AAVH_34296 [Aphelenchus avenae]
MDTQPGNDVFTLHSHGVSYLDHYATLMFAIKPGNPADPADNCKPGGVGNQTCELSPVTAEGDGQISLTFQYTPNTTAAAIDYSLMTLDFNRWSLDPIKEPAVNGCNRGWRMKGLSGWVDYC